MIKAHTPSCTLCREEKKNMSFLIPCTLLLTALLLSSFCITAPAPSPAPPPLSSCPLSSDWYPNVPFPIDNNTRYLTLFSPSSLSFPSNLSFSSSLTFTGNLTDEDLNLDCAFPRCMPSFILLQLQSQLATPPARSTMQLFLLLDTAFCPSQPPLISCSSLIPPQRRIPFELQNGTSLHCKPDPDNSDRSSHFEYVVSLTYTPLPYDADAAVLDAQVAVNCGFEINQTKIERSAAGEADDNITLIVGYITRGDASITITNTDPTMSSASSPTSPTSEVMVGRVSPNHNNSTNSNHMKVVVWVVVGVSMMASLLVGLIILALFIKRHRRRPSLVTSCFTGHVPPSTTTRAPFPHHHHLESSTTPMMMTLPPSPPYHTKDSQISGTASWLKQPNPR